MNDETCLQRLRSARPSAGRAEARLIDFILGDPAGASGMTIAELSERADVSYATVCRLPPGLGYAGVSDFREALARDAAGLRASFDKSDYRSMTFLDFYARQGAPLGICDLYASIVENCRTCADADAITAAADRLLSARFAYLVGQGTSAVSAHYAYLRLYRLGIPCAYESDAMVMKQRSALLQKGDVLLAISASGRTRVVVDCARIASANGAEVISLSDTASCPLARQANLSIFSSRRRPGNLSGDDFPLIIGQITLIDMLHASAFARAPDRARGLYVKTRDIGNSEKVD